MSEKGNSNKMVEKYTTLIENEELQYIQDCYAEVAQLFSFIVWNEFLVHRSGPAKYA